MSLPTLPTPTNFLSSEHRVAANRARPLEISNLHIYAPADLPAHFHKPLKLMQADMHLIGAYTPEVLLNMRCAAYTAADASFSTSMNAPGETHMPKLITCVVTGFDTEVETKWAELLQKLYEAMMAKDAAASTDDKYWIRVGLGLDWKLISADDLVDAGRLVCPMKREKLALSLTDWTVPNEDALGKDPNQLGEGEMKVMAFRIKSD